MQRINKTTLNPNVSKGTMIKIQDAKPVDAAPLQALYTKCKSRIKEEVKSIASIISTNQ